MMEKIQACMLAACQEHPGTVIGAAGGTLLAVLILLFGFWNIAFVICCCIAGLMVGRHLDLTKDADDDAPSFLDSLQDRLLDGMNRWR
jgi:uncharacterized membrane protein